MKVRLNENAAETAAFQGCRSLTNVKIPNSVTHIGKYAFEGCRSLTNVTIGNSVTEIGNFAFEDCTSLTSVTIPDSVTKIGYGAFSNCKKLTSVRIPSSVTEIDDDAFYGCPCNTSTSNSTENSDEEEFESLDEWYYSDKGEEDSSSFAEMLQQLVESEYPGVADYFEEPSVQGLQGGDFITFELKGKRYSYEFDWNDQITEIYEFGPEDAAHTYFDLIKEGIETGSAVVEEA